MRRPSILRPRSRSNSSAGKRSIAREIGHQIENTFGKFRKPGKRNGAGIRARVRAQIGAHAAQIFFDLAAGARSGAGAHHRGGHFGEARRAMRDAGVSAAEEKLRGNFRERAQFGEHDLHAVSEACAPRACGHATGRSGPSAERDSLAACAAGFAMCLCQWSWVSSLFRSCRHFLFNGTAQHNRAISPEPDIFARPPAPARA